LRSRADQLEVSREMISEIAGLLERYANKVLSLKGERRIGMQSLGSLLGALGLKLIAVEDTAALERNRTRYEACDAAQLHRPGPAGIRSLSVSRVRAGASNRLALLPRLTVATLA